MAFDRTKLNHVAGGVSPLPQTFEYSSSDDITAAGYFPKDIGINAGDKIIKVDITKANGLITGRTDTPYYMVANANGVLTASPFATDDEEEES